MPLTKKEAQDLAEFIKGEVESQVAAIIKEKSKADDEQAQKANSEDKSKDKGKGKDKEEELVNLDEFLQDYQSLKEELNSAKSKLKDSCNDTIKKTLIEAGVSEVVAELVDYDKLKNSDGEVDKEALSQLTKTLKQGSLDLGEELKGVPASDPNINQFYALAANSKEG